MPAEYKDKKSFFSEWLEKLQQESWQLELLISGLALFGIWESQSLLAKAKDYVAVNSVDELDFYLNAILLVFSASWVLFMINLLGHIIVRGLWIGAIGLRYVSGDIDYDKLNYSEVFSRYFKKRLGSFDEYIERLEKLSSVIFSFTFLLFFLIVSLISTIIFYAISAQIIDRIMYPNHEGPSPVYVLYGMAYFGLGLLVLIDFFTLGAFKKVQDKTFSRGYYFIYRFYSTISLSFAYRSLLLNFIDNSYTRRFFFFAIPYVLLLLVGIGGMYIEKYSFIPDFDRRASMRTLIAEESINYNFYDDLRDDMLNVYGQDDEYKKTKIDLLSLSNYENQARLNLFLEFKEKDQEFIEAKFPNVLPFKKKGLRHRFFGKNNLKDETFESFDINSNTEIRAMRKLINSKELPKDSTALELLGERIQEYIQKDKSEVDKIAREIRSKYDKLEKSYARSRLTDVKEAILSMYSISIDDMPIDTNYASFFYTHPNLQERGMLCHIPLDSLAPGSHLLMVTKVIFEEGCDNDCEEYSIAIPFIKN